MRTRVVVTGLGAITPLGVGVEATWEAMKAGKSGIRSVPRLVEAGMPVTFAGTVESFDAAAHMDRKDAKRMARFSQFAVAAAREAWQASGLDMARLDAERVGVYVGSGMGGLDVLEEEILKLRDRGPGRVSPFFIPTVIANMAAGNVAIQLGARGPNMCHVTACASGAHAIGEAFRALQRGEVDVILAGGAESTITPIGIAGFAAAKALSPGHASGDPARASRPFDADRNGFVMGEGAAVLVLETLEHATARGATIWAELAGYAATDDAFHITSPPDDGEGIQRAMRRALADAGLEPSAIGYVNAHGTSTELNDAGETAALKAVFGDHARRLAVSSTKSMTGHLLGAAGAVEALATVLALTHGILPPTINHETPDPACDLDVVPNVAREARIEAAMSNNMGFGGHNASLVLRRLP
jgi:3-oxoacyl-[acyl-carrier-protein] synthase II